MNDVVVIGMKGKNKIRFNSGVQKISHELKDKFVSLMIEAINNMGLTPHVYELHTPSATTEKIPRGQLWCPYCQSVHKFKKGEFGADVCPICGISSDDFYTRKYNNKK